MKGKEIYVMFQEIVEDGSTVRQTVDTFENQEDAQAELEGIAQEETERLAKEHNDWKMAAGSPDYFECAGDDYYNNHSTAKIVKSVIR